MTKEEETIIGGDWNILTPTRAYDVSRTQFGGRKIRWAWVFGPFLPTLGLDRIYRRVRFFEVKKK